MKTEIKNEDLFVEESSKLTALCRLCLSEGPAEWVSLFQEEALAESLMALTRVRVLPGDGLPTNACAPCAEELRSANRFRHMCEASDARLRQTALGADYPLKSELDTNDAGSAAGESEEYIASPSLETDLFARKKVASADRKTKFICNICDKSLSSKYSLQKHTKSMHETRERAGTVTGHGAARRFHCCECAYSTPHSQSLVYHARVHTGEKPFACEVCPRRFSQPGSLACHRKTHSDRTYYTCALCGKQFKYKETYEMHKKVHITDKPFSCSICQKGLKSRKTLEGHMNRHLNVRNYSCETCGVTFVTRVELLNHSRKHSDERKYSCHLCDFRTYVKKGLDLHVRRHTGERPFKCPLCPLACYTRGELKCHSRKHSKEKNYACPVCQLRFIHSSSVNKHTLKAHGQKYSRNNLTDRRIIK